jgi:hypothetical protein
MATVVQTECEAHQSDIITLAGSSLPELEVFERGNVLSHDMRQDALLSNPYDPKFMQSQALDSLSTPLDAHADVAVA